MTEHHRALDQAAVPEEVLYPLVDPQTEMYLDSGSIKPVWKLDQELDHQPEHRVLQPIIERSILAQEFNNDAQLRWRNPTKDVRIDPIPHKKTADRPSLTADPIVERHVRTSPLKRVSDIQARRLEVAATEGREPNFGPMSAPDADPPGDLDYIEQVTLSKEDIQAFLRIAEGSVLEELTPEDSDVPLYGDSFTNSDGKVVTWFISHRDVDDLMSPDEATFRINDPAFRIEPAVSVRGDKYSEDSRP